jgi:DNA-binding IclR family transcriptional regulator
MSLIMGIQSVHRALDILSLFSAAQPRLGITEMSKTLGLPKATVHGLVRTLVQRAFLYQDRETKKYCLGLNIYELGTILAGTLKINQVGAGPAQRLAQKTHLMVRIAIWDQDTVLVTLNLFPHSRVIQFHQLGPRVPAYCSALGKAILAWLKTEELASYLKHTRLSSYTTYTITDRKRLLQELEQTRQQGYAVDREECLVGLACIGAPIFEHTGRPIASLSISGGPDLLKDKQLSSIILELSRTAMEISHSMGYLPEAISPKIQGARSRHKAF